MRPFKIHIRESSWLARLAAKKLKVDAVAITLGNTIHLHNASRHRFLNDERWLRHEMAHVRQFRRYGFFTFIGLYLWESWRKGYHKNKYEVEARASEDVITHPAAFQLPRR